ncbi:MAG: Fic family protein [Flavobacteriales bacterium]
MTPPYTITPEILKLIESIGVSLGEINGRYLTKPTPQLRKENRIRTIQASLAIEGNSLSLEQITAILSGKRVIGSQREIVEVRNAIETYDRLESFDPFSTTSFLSAHGALMKGLIDDAGKFRRKSVGIMHGSKVAHIAPPASGVKGLMQELMKYAKQAPDSMLIKSCVFHYEMEFIHPFMDGNGRMGRLWQTLLLSKHHPVFSSLPFETIIRDTQQDYYKALASSDKLGQSTPFIAYMLGVIDESLRGLTKDTNPVLKESDRVQYFLSLKNESLDAGARAESRAFTRKDYMQVFKTLSTATASRDLNAAVKCGVLQRMGEGNQARYGEG